MSMIYSYVIMFTIYIFALEIPCFCNVTTFKSQYIPGWRFNPTDNELVMFYLKNKVLGITMGPPMIAEVDIYQFEPWVLPSMSALQTNDQEWYFLCNRAGRCTRNAKGGTWRMTGGSAKDVVYCGRVCGIIKSFTYYINGVEKTNWIMKEYILKDTETSFLCEREQHYVLCKFYERNGSGPMHAEQYVAKFVEEDWLDNIMTYEEVSNGKE